MKTEKAIEILKEQKLFTPLGQACHVAVDALENELPFMGNTQRDVFKSVLYERYRQDNKWGQQNHPPELWTGILGEEYGELCQAINESIFNNGTDLGGYENVKKEAVQVAAVAVAFLECLERNKRHWFPERR